METSNPTLALVEPWFGESHKAFVLGVAKHCGLPCELVTMPSSKWKWRMRMGSQPLATLLEKLTPWPNVFLFSDYVNLPALQGFVPRLAQVPKIIYFHENQLTYPIRKGTKRNLEFCAINVLSCLIAQRCIFCSHQQMEAFLDEIPSFLQHDDTIDPVEVITTIEDKSSSIPVGVDFEIFDKARKTKQHRKNLPLRIIWPHRFEHDKNPEDFFSVLLDLAKEGLPFEISAVGRSYLDLPPIMIEAKEKLASHIIDWGFLEGDDYAKALANSDIVVSTAWQETQGLAVIEAIRAGCIPLLPNRLSYPEVLGDPLKKEHLYQNKGELRRRLRGMMKNPDETRQNANHWQEMKRFDWNVVGPKFGNLARNLIL